MRSIETVGEEFNQLAFVRHWAEAFGRGGSLIDDFVRRVQISDMKVTEINEVVSVLSGVDWEGICTKRDKKKREEEEAFQNQIICCSRSDCHNRAQRRQMVECKYTKGFGALYCPECAEKTTKEYEPPCILCGEIVVVTRRLTKNVLCERCGQDYDRDLLLYYEKNRVERHNSRARELHREATLTLEEWLKILSKFKGKCAYCGGRYEVLEHYIPLSGGGGTTADNCFPSCHQCNVTKGSVIPAHSFDSRPAS